MPSRPRISDALHNTSLLCCIRSVSFNLSRGPLSMIMIQHELGASYLLAHDGRELSHYNRIMAKFSIVDRMIFCLSDTRCTVLTSWKHMSGCRSFQLQPCTLHPHHQHPTCVFRPPFRPIYTVRLLAFESTGLKVSERR